MGQWVVDVKAVAPNDGKYLCLSCPGDSIPHVLWHTGRVLLSGSQRYREQKGWTRPFPGLTHLSGDFCSTSQETLLRPNTARVAEADPSFMLLSASNFLHMLLNRHTSPSILQRQPAEMPPSPHHRKISKRGWTHETPWKTSFLRLKESNPATLSSKQIIYSKEKKERNNMKQTFFETKRKQTNKRKT